MTKTEFNQKIYVPEGTELHEDFSPLHAEWRWRLRSSRYWLRTDENELSHPGHIFYRPGNEITISSVTANKYSKKNLDRINNAILINSDVIKKWEDEWAEYKKSAIYKKREDQIKQKRRRNARDQKRRAIIINAAKEAGLEDGISGSDSFELSILDCCRGAKKLASYNATGDFLAVVAQSRERTYSTSYMRRYGRGSNRTDVFLVGRNENGNAFAHQLPCSVEKICDAVSWVWRGAAIEQRQGDIAIAQCNLKNVEGEEMDIRIVDSHFVHGEIRQNGSLYARNAFIYHEKDQHPYMYIGSEWKRIVIARRSKRNMSSSD